jgi:predicted adenine nucleotide alpha hydrolase (AANH) superfamily ATPase
MPEGGNSVADDRRPPHGEKRVLLHACCAPCCGGILEELEQAGIDSTVFFCNPNIHPAEEYERRKSEVIRFCRKQGIAFVDADSDPVEWEARVKGLENEPERGRRCSACFDLRMEKAAAYAAAHGFHVFATSLSLSRWKDRDQVNASGTRAAARHPGLAFWPADWRKRGGAERANAVSKREQFYRQKYCGCVYSRNPKQRPVLE